jgi:hypothetical protein
MSHRCKLDNININLNINISSWHPIRTIWLLFLRYVCDILIPCLLMIELEWWIFEYGNDEGEMAMTIRMIMPILVIWSNLMKSKSHFSEKKENELLLRVNVGDCRVLYCPGNAFIPGWMIVISSDLFRPPMRIRWMSLIVVKDFRRFRQVTLKILDVFIIMRVDKMWKIRLIVWTKVRSMAIGWHFPISSVYTQSPATPAVVRNRGLIRVYFEYSGMTSRIEDQSEYTWNILE